MTDLEAQIRTAYQQLAERPRGWVRLARLVPLVDAPKTAIDATLTQMARTNGVSLAPDSNRKVLTEADHAAAVRIGVTDLNLISIEPEDWARTADGLISTTTLTKVTTTRRNVPVGSVIDGYVVEDVLHDLDEGTTALKLDGQLGDFLPSTWQISYHRP